jgi:hypothetical protein
MVVCHRILINFAAVFALMVVLNTPLLAASEKNSKASQETSPPATTQTRELPDAPKPKLQEPSDGNQERVDETRIWWRDVDYPRCPWSHAFGDLKFLIPAAALVGLTAVQIRRTDQCLAAHKGSAICFLGTKAGPHFTRSTFLSRAHSSFLPRN